MERGIITSVYYDNGVIECDVQPFRASGAYTNVEFLPANSGFMASPEQGMTVNMDVGRDGRRYIVGLRSHQNAYPDSLKEGEIVLQIDDGTKIQITRNDDSNHQVAIEASDGVDIAASGDVNLEAGGDILIDGINFTQHTHDYDDSTISDTGDGSGSESTTQKTTGPPE